MPYYQEIAEQIGTDRGRCVLLLGPELSVDKSGKYYKSFYKELAENNPSCILQYFENENIFMFKDRAGLDGMIEPIRKFYSDIGDETLLEDIAKIKFPLVVNVCPDRSLNKVLERVYKYKEGEDYFYSYRYIDIEESPDDQKARLGSIPEPTKSAPVIYNMFGDWEDYDSIICDHERFYDTVQHLMNKDALPKNIQTFLARANSFVFLGFNFDSWHYQLICHKLGLGLFKKIKKSYGSQYFCGNNNKVQIVMKDYFKVSFVEDNPAKTIQEIIQACEVNYPESLRKTDLVNSHYSVYISYSWAEKEADIIELITHILNNKNISSDQKKQQIKNITSKAGNPANDSKVIDLLNQKDYDTNHEIEKWYMNLGSTERNQENKAANSIDKRINVNGYKKENEIYDRELIVRLIEKKLIGRGIKVFRDKNEVTYGDSIDSFMNRIGKGKAVIRIVSDKYLKSRYCMDEAIRIKKYSNSESRIFTVVLGDSLSLKDFEQKLGDENNIEYQKYWQAIIESIYSRINTEITNAIEKERIKRHYSIYIDIYDFILDFVKSIQDEVRLNINTSFTVSPLNSLTKDEEDKLDAFIDAIEIKLKQ